MSTSDFSSAIDRAPGARSKSDEKSEVLIGVVEIMLTVNYSHSGDSATLIGNFTPSPRRTTLDIFASQPPPSRVSLFIFQVVDYYLRAVEDYQSA